MNGAMIAVAAAVMVGCGVVLGILIAFAVRFFRVDSDPRIDAIAELLPGANCGGCGQAGCLDFAKALVAGKLAPNQCPVSSQEIRTAVAQVLGVDVGESTPMVAVVLCGGSASHVKTATRYNGVTDCISASLVGGGPKSCTYGCLGFSSCARACPFHAIEMIDQLAVVHPELCVGCGQCVRTCPRGLIKLIPADAKIAIYCSSKAKAPVRRAACTIPCIGCRKCVKAAPEGMFRVDGTVISVNYENAELPGPEVVTAAGCPTGCLQRRIDHEGITRGNGGKA